MPAALLSGCHSHAALLTCVGRSSTFGGKKDASTGLVGILETHQRKHHTVAEIQRIGLRSRDFQKQGLVGARLSPRLRRDLVSLGTGHCNAVGMHGSLPKADDEGSRQGYTEAPRCGIRLRALGGVSPTNQKKDPAGHPSFFWSS